MRIATICIHYPELAAPRVPIGPENDLGAIGRPRWVFIPFPRVRRQTPHVAAVRIDGVDFIVTPLGRNERNTIVAGENTGS